MYRDMPNYSEYKECFLLIWMFYTVYVLFFICIFANMIWLITWYVETENINALTVFLEE